MSLAFSIAKRFLSSNKSQSFFIILGIAVGVSVQIFVGMLIQSLQADLLDTTIGSSSHITITNEDENLIDDYEEIIDKVSEDESYSVVAPIIDRNGFLKTKKKDYAILLKGISYESDENIYKVDEKLTEGEFPKEKNEVIVGKELKESLELNLDDKIKITDSNGNILEFKIAGFYDFNVKSINELWIMTNINTMQDIFLEENQISYIGTQIKDVFIADELADILKEKEYISEDLTIKNWKEENGELLSGLNGQETSSLMIQIFVMLSVVLAIASVLTITVVQKSKQVGILKAMGITNKNASYIFLFQGLILGFLGALLGTILGILLLKAFTTFAVSDSGEPIINIYINYGFIVLSFAISTIASVIASLIPAIKSGKLSPMEVIRNG